MTFLIYGIFFTHSHSHDSFVIYVAGSSKFFVPGTSLAYYIISTHHLPGQQPFLNIQLSDNVPFKSDLLYAAVAFYIDNSSRYLLRHLLDRKHTNEEALGTSVII